MAKTDLRDPLYQPMGTVSVCVRNYTVRILNMAIILSIAVLGLQLIVGYTGQFSFGHAAFYGIGA
jgi:branched-chain amino acid transport system permease protein